MPLPSMEAERAFWAALVDLPGLLSRELSIWRVV
jgi:hypothetical protein